ncbi:uncharacterized protein LOC109846043 [Asparagus officinalis]|uniref:uncharacterized protein LOC109846043 n=1 Tax=Asparagus officinalis TaxID=4686 RepID=UPI00098E8372|nr:uncharacterized protein LOC109846043 [Asparagus officinalis]
MEFLVNEAQCAFVQGRQITSNIMLAQELVKSYNRKNIYSRAMLNIDIRKAFDSISWDFISDMLKGLGFPSVMVKWFMSCITSPKYSLSFNGSLHGYFKDDLLFFSKGDLYSVEKLYQCVKNFGLISGLEANHEKSSIYYGGVEEPVKASINNRLRFNEGVLPFKYLGVPLITKRMSTLNCVPLFKNIEGQFKKWVNHRNLSYAGRLQVIKSDS